MTVQSLHKRRGVIGPVRRSLRIAVVESPFCVEADVPRERSGSRDEPPLAPFAGPSGRAGATLGFPDQVTFTAGFPAAVPNSVGMRKAMLYPLSYGGT